MRKLLFLLPLLLVVACGNEDVQRAEAEKIRTRTNLEATRAAAAVVREQADWEAAEAREQADWEAVRGARNFAIQFILVVGAFAITVTVALCLLIVVVRWLQFSRASVRGAALRARQIYVDPETGTWPVLLTGDSALNLQIGEVYSITAPRQGRLPALASDMIIRALGVGGRRAERIARYTKDGQAADSIPALAASLPLITGPVQEE